MSTHVWSPEHRQGSAIEVLGSPDHGCGTVCPLNCDSKAFASPSLGDYLRHFCSLRLDAHCDFFVLMAPGVSTLTYLLTYLEVQISCACCRFRQAISIQYIYRRSGTDPMSLLIHLAVVSVLFLVGDALHKSLRFRRFK